MLHFIATVTIPLAGTVSSLLLLLLAAIVASTVINSGTTFTTKDATVAATATRAASGRMGRWRRRLIDF